MPITIVIGMDPVLLLSFLTLLLANIDEYVKRDLPVLNPHTCEYFSQVKFCNRFKPNSTRGVYMKTEEGPSFRQLKGISKLYGDIMFALIPITGIIGVINLPSYFGISLYLQQYIGFIFGLVIASCFVIKPLKIGSSMNKLPWYDLTFSIISIMPSRPLIFLEDYAQRVSPSTTLLPTSILIHRVSWARPSRWQQPSFLSLSFLAKRSAVLE
jgi:hypothetical protein